MDSFLEICRHKAVYRCVIDILSQIAGRPWLAKLLWKQPGQKKSIYSLLLSIKDKAQKVLDRYGHCQEFITHPFYLKRRYETEKFMVPHESYFIFQFGNIFEQSFAEAFTHFNMGTMGVPEFNL